MSKPPANQEREVEITCNWCIAKFKYRAKLGEAHNRTSCPWCGKAVHVPIDRLMPINGDN